MLLLPEAMHPHSSRHLPFLSSRCMLTDSQSNRACVGILQEAAAKRLRVVNKSHRSPHTPLQPCQATVSPPSCLVFRSYPLLLFYLLSHSVSGGCACSEAR